MACHLNFEKHIFGSGLRLILFLDVGNGLPTDGNKSVDVTVGEKFGCNISHLGHYSDISGKTLDKFVSAISSFKYKSSGSRASGLRAPVRDVKNICPRR